MPETGTRGAKQLFDHSEKSKSMQKGQRLHQRNQRSSPPHRPPRVSSICPRVSLKPAKKEKTDQHGTAKKSQAPKHKGIPPKQPNAHVGKAEPSQKQQNSEQEFKWGGKSKTEALKTWLLNWRRQKERPITLTYAH